MFPNVSISLDQKFGLMFKKTLPEKTAKPICLNIKRILLIEAPANRVEKLKSMFPAGNRPSTRG